MAYTQNDPFNPVNTKPKPELGPNDYGKPMGKPLPRPERRQPGYSDGSGFDFNAWRAGKKRKPLPGQDPQGGGVQPGGPTLDAKPTPFPGPRGGGGMTTFPNQQPWGGGGNPYIVSDFGDGRSGMKPPQTNDFMYRWRGVPGQSGEYGGINPGGGMQGMQGDPRAGGLNKVTGQWTPPDPAYLEGLKNGTIEPEWKRRERMNQPITQGPGQIGFNKDPRYGGGRQPLRPGMEYRPVSGQPPWLEGQMLPMDIGPGSANEQAQAALKAQWEANGGGPKGSPDVNYGAPVQRGPGAPPVGTGPGSMGKPQQPGGGRQPLRPGMEYRPRGGQRPVGGGMQGAQQDGGNQMYDQIAQAQDSLGGLQMSPEQNAQWNMGQGGQEDPQENMRRRLMQMQRQGPNSNPYYGAF